MAGAGKKTFVAGEVLTAAQVNDYLMDQAVMRFSGSAARAASITAPSEGMVTYLDDSNVLEYYDGSAWVEVYPASDVAASLDSKIAASLITGSAQVLVGVDAASLIALAASVDGQVLTANASVAGGLTFQAIPGAGQSAWANVSSASTNIGMTSELGPGFYKIATSGTTTFTSAQFRFVTSTGEFYGASLSGGAGFFTVPDTVASINATTGTPFTVLIEEVSGISAILEEGPTVEGLDFTAFVSGSFSASAPATATNIGYWQLDTGSFATIPTSGSTFTSGSNVGSSLTFDEVANVKFAQRSADGIWSTATSASTRYPFVVFYANDTYTPPPWSTSADILIVAGGGGGGGVFNPSPSPFAFGSGAGGGGGLTQLLNEPTTGSVAITVGAPGPGGATSTGTPGGNSLFGSASAAGGGAGPGQPGGSGGGGSGGGGGAGTGIAGQGNPGGVNPSVLGGGGGGAGSAGGSDGSGGSGSAVYGITWSYGGPSTPGGNATYGGGGTGARRTSTGGAAGSNGGPGYVVVRAK